MRHIVKKIWLGQFKTRYPLTYPALNNGNLSLITSSTYRTHDNANYNNIPYGINETICGLYSSFTDEMGTLYGGTVLSYITLERWYQEFLEYYSILRGGDCKLPYSSATEAYIASNEGFNYDISPYEEMDINHIKHGGDKFYQWLCDNYFISLDFKNEYYTAISNGVLLTCEYVRWADYVNNLENPIMYYPNVVLFYGKMHNYDTLFYNNPSSNGTDYEEYMKYGGHNMCLLLKYWLDKITPIFEKINNTVSYYKKDLEASATIQIPLMQKVRDYGNFEGWVENFTLGKEYNLGNICTYDNDTYILRKGNGYVINALGEYEFDSDGWMRYGDYYKMSHPEEFSGYGTTYELSGRTVSSLDSFLQTQDTVDAMANSIPGYYRASSGETFVQPAEDTLLDLNYEIGKTVNETLTSDGIYSGDVLLGVKIFFNDTDGNTIATSVMGGSEGDDILGLIQDSMTEASKESNIDSTIHIDFIYYKGTNYTYSDGKVRLVPKKINGVNFNVGVKYVEHCTLSLETYPYYLSASEFYDVRYYKVNKDIVSTYSEEYGINLDVALTDWYITPYAYDDERIYASPILRKEELLNFSLPENRTGSIYVDRGYATALDKHLKLGEITSCDTLEKYGNGTFQFIADETENT